MKRIVLVAALALASAAQAQSVVTPVMTATTTNSGQPIVLPQGPVQVSVSVVTIPPGETLPVHRHPYPRYAVVQEGRILVTNTETGGEVEFGPGDFVIEALGQWHTGKALGDVPVKLLVIDHTAPGRGNTERRQP